MLAGSKPLACVLGDMDLVRPLGLAGIRCAVAVPPGAASRFSRFTQTAIDWANPWEQPDDMVEKLMQFGKAQAERPVLFFESDAELLMVSRHRDQLKSFFRFAIADQTLVEDLVDKERFQRLAERMRLPVPSARRLWPAESIPTDVDMRYPIIVKPLTRRPQTWRAVVQAGKALRIENADELRRVWPQLAASGLDLIAQELIPGPETCIESYHVYVNATDEIVGEFTGRKIRTYPRDYGDSTALETTDATDVAVLGRALVRRLHLRGVAKFDFKRAPDGTLYLLEINPRFNLWHHLGAVAGVNLPALVYADLVGERMTSPGTARAGLRWCRMWQDARAARQTQLSIGRWLRWTLSCEAKRLLAWDDPMPFAGAVLWRVMDGIRSRLNRNEVPRPRISTAIVASDA